MKMLVVGGGGREHALAWALARSARVDTVFVAPGNAGTALDGRSNADPGRKLRNVAIAADDFPGLAGLAERESVALTVIGPEAPLVDGVREFFDARALPCLGPSKAAAQLEGSKAYAKAFMARHDIPTAPSATFTSSEVEAAVDYIRARGAPIVVKADGLAAGKGVVVAQDDDEAVAAARAMLSGARFGDAGRQVVVEALLLGEEASFICLCDGERAVALASAQDHKPRDEGDRGPNTGGMGAYSPAPVITPEIHDRVMAEVIRPAIRGMAAEGQPYQGFLYAGLMVSPQGAVHVVEFNCRFGDPEAQPVLMRLRSDFATLCLDAAAGALPTGPLDWDPRPALGVVLAAGGYPLGYGKGDAIAGLAEASPDTKVFHAGTELRGGQVVTSGGRVLCVVGVGTDLAAAAKRAYDRAAGIHWRHMYYRRDIGYRTLNRAKI